MTPVLAELSELHAAMLQAGVTFGVAVLCAYLYRTYRRGYFALFAWAWFAYSLRLGCIVAFLTQGAPVWLYAHQVLTGWTAILLLASALSFAGAWRWRPWYLALLLFPVAWSWIAIYQLDRFILAAGPAVLFLSLATLWTGVVFLRHWRLTRTRGAAMLAVVFFAWGLHHLDYPLLRARGAWNPWGYYLDILFILATSIGIVMLVLEQMDRDLRSMLALSGDRLPRGNAAHMDHLVQRLNSNLLARTQELEQLSDRLVQQHEVMRRTVSRELHDQSAQVWAAVRLQLGGLREEVPAELAPRIDRLLALVDDGMRSIRTVTEHLRPPILDDL
jgi:signal transduction histidine kinase